MKNRSDWKTKRCEVKVKDTMERGDFETIEISKYSLREHEFMKHTIKCFNEEIDSDVHPLTDLFPVDTRSFLANELALLGFSVFEPYNEKPIQMFKYVSGDYSQFDLVLFVPGCFTADEELPNMNLLTPITVISVLYINDFSEEDMEYSSQMLNIYGVVNREPVKGYYIVGPNEANPCSHVFILSERGAVNFCNDITHGDSFDRRYLYYNIASAKPYSHHDRIVPLSFDELPPEIKYVSV